MVLTSAGWVVAALVAISMAPSREQVGRELYEAVHRADLELWARFAEELEHARARQAEQRAGFQAIVDQANQVEPADALPPLVETPQGPVPPLHLYFVIPRDDFQTVVADGLGRDQDRVTLSRDIASARERAGHIPDFLILRVRANDAFQRGVVFTEGVVGAFHCDRIRPGFLDTNWTIHEYIARVENRAA